jgi:hypothetical protein
MIREHAHYRLNLAARPFVNLAIPAVLALVALLAVVAFSVANVMVLLATERDTRGITAELDTVQNEIATYRERTAAVRSQIASLDFDTLGNRIDFINGIITRRSMSWTRLFNRLEQLAPANLTMVRITPAVRGDQIELGFNVIVPSQSVIFEFIDRLENSPWFKGVTLVSENRQGSDGATTWELRTLYRNEE